MHGVFTPYAVKNFAFCTYNCCFSLLILNRVRSAFLSIWTFKIQVSIGSNFNAKFKQFRPKSGFIHSNNLLDYWVRYHSLTVWAGHLNNPFLQFRFYPHAETFLLVEPMFARKLYDPFIGRPADLAFVSLFVFFLYLLNESLILGRNFEESLTFNLFNGLKVFFRGLESAHICRNPI